MEDTEIGDRTAYWFWGMIESLGLSDCHDINYDADSVSYILDRFLNREYRQNGEGGLFTLNHPAQDMRTVEIWYQMSMYLNEFIQKEN